MQNRRDDAASFFFATTIQVVYMITRKSFDSAEIHVCVKAYIAVRSHVFGLSFVTSSIIIRLATMNASSPLSAVWNGIPGVARARVQCFVLRDCEYISKYSFFKTKVRIRKTRKSGIKQHSSKFSLLCTEIIDCHLGQYRNCSIYDIYMQL